MALGRHSDFNRLWFGQTVSNFGDKISLLALPTLAVVVLDGGALEVGVLGALRFLPFLLLAPFAGLVADRVSRRTVMIVADLGRFLALGTIPLAFALDSVSMTHVYIVAALTGILTTFFEVSYQSWLPQLIGTENLIEGNTKLQISRSVAEAVGAGAGGALIQLLGAARAITADAFTFLISLLALLVTRHRDVRERTEERKASAKAEMKEGMKTLFGNPVLRGLFTANVVVNLGAAMGDALLIVYAYKVLDLSPGQVGIATSPSCRSSSSSAPCSPRWSPRASPWAAFSGDHRGGPRRGERRAALDHWNAAPFPDLPARTVRAARRPAPRRARRDPGRTRRLEHHLPGAGGARANRLAHRLALAKPSQPDSGPVPAPGSRTGHRDPRRPQGRRGLRPPRPGLPGQRLAVLLATAAPPIVVSDAELGFSRSSPAGTDRVLLDTDRAALAELPATRPAVTSGTWPTSSSPRAPPAPPRASPWNTAAWSTTSSTSTAPTASDGNWSSPCPCRPASTSASTKPWASWPPAARCSSCPTRHAQPAPAEAAW
ncbi:hypothetical protein SAVIM40S_07001 [Streptomyces avidinii]